MTQQYHKNSKIIHWLMAVVIIGLLGSGVFMANFIAGDASYRGDVYHIHKSFGVVALFLIIIRVINRIKNTPPTLPESIKKIEQTLAHIGHNALYALMLLMPLSGYLMSNSYGYQVKLFSITMPDLVAKNYDLGAIFSGAHQYLGYLMVAVLVAHIAGALKHRYFDENKENDVLKRIT